jgi:RNA polymerase primary sigma factor
MYLRDIGRIPLLTREKEGELGRRIRSGDASAVHELVQANLRFVVNISKKYMNRGIPLADLVTEGNLGLYEAARRFDERRGCAFISYAVWWIRRNLNKALADQIHLVHYPHSRRDTLRASVARESLEKRCSGAVFERGSRTRSAGRARDPGSHASVRLPMVTTRRRRSRGSEPDCGTSGTVSAAGGLEGVR